MSRFQPIAHICALMLSTHLHAMALDSSNSAAAIEIIRNAPTIEAQVQRKIRNFLDELGQGSFSFADAPTETQQLKIEKIKAGLEIARDVSIENSSMHMQTLTSLWTQTHSESIVYNMITIAKRLNLMDESRDLYFLSAFMIRQRGLLKLPSIPYPVENDEEEPSIHNDLERIKSNQNLETNLDLFLSHYATRIFIKSPLLRNKMALLFPSNDRIPLHTGCAIMEGIIRYDENGNLITTENERYNAAERMYRKSGTPQALYNLGLLIKDFQIHTDENGVIIETEDQRYAAAADLFRKSKTTHALYNLAVFIYEGKTDKDEEHIAIRTISQRNKTVARLYQESKTPEALYNIGILLSEGKMHEDENGKSVNTQEERDRTVVRLWQNSRIPSALHNLAVWIRENKINIDENNQPIITQEQRDAAEARLYRQSKDNKSLNSLAIMIYGKKVNSDEYNIPFFEEERNATAARLFIASGDQDALHNIANMLLNREIEYDQFGRRLITDLDYKNTIFKLTETMNGNTKHLIRGSALVEFCWDSLEHKKQALEEFRLALQNGYSEALPAYAKLSEHIESIENRTRLTHSTHISESSSSANAETTETSIESQSIAEAPTTTNESTDEDDDYLSDSDKIDQDVDASLPTFSDESSTEYTLIQQRRLKEWKKRREKEKRKEASENWDRKKQAALCKKVSLNHSDTNRQDFIREKWHPDAVEGRVNLAQFYDERIIMLINDIKNGGHRGKPETLAPGSEYEGCMSRRITGKHRLIYKFDRTTKELEIVECGGHYKKSRDKS